MKKFFSLFLALAFMLSFISLPVSADEYSILQTIENTSLSGSTLTVTCSIEGNFSPSYGYAAVYGSDGILKGAATKKLTKAADAFYTIENYTYSSGDYVKAFLWDDNNAPIAESATSAVSVGDKIEGIVVETYLSCPYYYEFIPTVSILVTNSSLEDYPAGESYTFNAENVNVQEYLGYTVVASVGKNEDDSPVIYDLAPKEGSNTLLTLTSDLLSSIEPDEVIYYETSTSEAPVEAPLESSVYINGAEIDLSDRNIVLNGFNSDYYYTEDFFFIADKLDKITLLDNDNDGAFEFIFTLFPTYDSIEFVVEEIYNDGNLWLFSTKDEQFEFKIDTDNDNSFYTIIKDGTKIDASQIAAGNVITVLDESADIITVYVSSTRVEGTVSEVDGDVYTIDDTDYKISPLYPEGYIDVGTSGVFYLNAFDKIARVELPQLDYEYLYLTDTTINEDAFAGTSYLIKGITSSGEEETYALSKRVDVYTPDGNATKVTAKTAYRYLEEYRGVLKIALDDNSKLFTAILPDGAYNFETYDIYEYDAEYMRASYNETRMSYGIVDLSPDTVIFNLDTTDNTITATTVEMAFTQGSSYSFIAYGAADEAAQVLLAYDLDAAGIEPEPVICESEYVFLIDYAQSEGSFDETNYYVQLMTMDGVVDPYLINSKNVSIYTPDGTFSSLTNKEAYEFVSSYVGVAKVAFTQKDEKIAEFYLPGCEAFSENKAYENTSSVYNADAFTLGEVTIDYSTILINIDTTEDDLDASLGAYSAYKALEDNEEYFFLSYGKENEAADVILTKDLDISLNADETVMVVTKVTDTTNKDDVKVTGVRDGELLSVYVTAEDYEKAPLEEGNVFIYTLEGGYATDIHVLFNSTFESVGELAENIKGIVTNVLSDNYVSIHYGEITYKTSTAVTVGTDKFYMSDQMNIIIVDYTTASTSVSTGTWSNVQTSVKYKKTAFVKTLADIEDEISDIVVFIEPMD